MRSAGYHRPSSGQRSQRPVSMAFRSAAGSAASAVRLRRIGSILAGRGSSSSRATARRKGTAPSGINGVIRGGTGTFANTLTSKIAVRPMTANDMVEVALCEEESYPDLARVGMLEGAHGLGLVRLATACTRARICHGSLSLFTMRYCPLPQWSMLVPNQWDRVSNLCSHCLYIGLVQHRQKHPEGCFVAVGSTRAANDYETATQGADASCEGECTCGSCIVGYVLSGPARLEDCPLSLDPSIRPADSHSENWTGDPGGAQAETIYLHDIVVRPEARQFGVGRKLLAAVEELAVKVGAPTITLTAVAGAWEHWSRRGFEELARKSTAKVAESGPGLLSSAAVERLQSYPDAMGDVRFMRRAR